MRPKEMTFDWYWDCLTDWGRDIPEQLTKEDLQTAWEDGRSIALQQIEEDFAQAMRKARS